MATAAIPQTSTQFPVHYKTVRVHDVDIFTGKLARKRRP